MSICMILGKFAIPVPVRKVKRLHTCRDKGSIAHLSAIINYVTAQRPKIHCIQT